jgi:hypothetical protein
MTEGLSTTTETEDPKKKSLLAMAQRVGSIAAGRKPFYEIVEESRQTLKDVVQIDVYNACFIACLIANNISQEDSYRIVVTNKEDIGKYFDDEGSFIAKSEDLSEGAKVAKAPTLSREGDGSETVSPSFQARVDEQRRRLEVVSPGLPDTHSLAVRMVKEQVERGGKAANETTDMAARVLRSTSVSRRPEAKDALLLKQQDAFRSEIAKLRTEQSRILAEAQVGALAEEAQISNEAQVGALEARAALAKGGIEGWKDNLHKYAKERGSARAGIEQEILRLQNLKASFEEYKDEINYIEPFFEEYSDKPFFEGQGGRQSLLDLALRARRARDLDPRIPSALASLLVALDEAVRHPVEGKPFTAEVYGEYLTDVILDGGVSKDFLLLDLGVLQNGPKGMKLTELSNNEAERKVFLQTVINTAVRMLSGDRDSRPSDIFIRAFNQRVNAVLQDKQKKK